MATHSSILAWEIPWTEEPGELKSMGSQEWDSTVTKPPPKQQKSVLTVLKSGSHGVSMTVQTQTLTVTYAACEPVSLTLIASCVPHTVQHH